MGFLGYGFREGPTRVPCERGKHHFVQASVKGYVECLICQIIYTQGAPALGMSGWAGSIAFPSVRHRHIACRIEWIDNGVKRWTYPKENVA